MATKEDDDDLGRVQWGGTLVVHEVYERDDRSLGVRPPQPVLDALASEHDLVVGPLTVSADGRRTQQLGRIGDEPLLHRLSLGPDACRNFAIGPFGDDETERRVRVHLPRRRPTDRLRPGAELSLVSPRQPRPGTPLLRRAGTELSDRDHR